MRPPTSPWRRWAAVAALTVAMPTLTGLALETQEKSAPKPPPQPEASARGSGDDGRRMGGRRELTEQDMDRIVQTARDIEPAWGDALQAMRAEDPTRLRQRLGAQTRMLIGLAAIRDRQPELYRARVDDFRLQRQLRGAAERAIKAREAADADAEAQALVEVRELARRQFELDMKARAYELLAMEQALKDARRRLQEDIAQRDMRLQEVLDAVGRGEMPRLGRGAEGPGFGPDAPWRRRDPDAPRPGDSGPPQKPVVNENGPRARP
jgi:hypothetical protein